MYFTAGIPKNSRKTYTLPTNTKFSFIAHILTSKYPAVPYVHHTETFCGNTSLQYYKSMHFVCILRKILEVLGSSWYLKKSCRLWMICTRCSYIARKHCVKLPDLHGNITIPEKGLNVNIKYRLSNFFLWYIDTKWCWA